MQRPGVSVVVPMFRTAETLTALHARLLRALRDEPSLEIVYVDDACDAGSGPAIDRLAAADARVVALHHPANRGQAHAVRTGLERARGHTVVVLDADLQDPPEAIPRLLAALRQGPHDAIFAGRRGWYEGPLRMLSGHLFKRLVARWAGTPPDAGGFVALSRPLVDELLAAPPEHPYLLAAIAVTRRPTRSIPVRRSRRPSPGGASSSCVRVQLGFETVRALWAARAGSRHS